KVAVIGRPGRAHSGPLVDQVAPNDLPPALSENPGLDRRSEGTESSPPRIGKPADVFADTVHIDEVACPSGSGAPVSAALEERLEHLVLTDEQLHNLRGIRGSARGDRWRGRWRDRHPARWSPRRAENRPGKGRP